MNARGLLRGHRGKSPFTMRVHIPSNLLAVLPPVVATAPAPFSPFIWVPQNAGPQAAMWMNP
jgi:hypothetical protein